MINFNDLKINPPSVPFTEDKWNGLVDNMGKFHQPFIGFGTDNPQAKLHIVNKNEDASHVNGGSSLIIGPTDQSNLRLGYHEDYSWIQSHGSKPLAINPLSNKVGIGTTTPKTTLHVDGDYYGRGHMYLHAYEGDDRSGTAYIQARDTSGTSNIDLQLRSQQNGRVVDGLRIESNGNVGIGTSRPTTKLEVAGTLKANAFTYSSNVNHKLIVMQRFNNLGNNVKKRTSYRVRDWNAAIAGFLAADGDIQENDVGTIMNLRMISSGGYWYIYADFRSHRNHENWYVDVMFVRKELSRSIGY